MALIKASEELGCQDLIVLTRDHEEIEVNDGRTIRYVPLWMWLLEHRP